MASSRKSILVAVDFEGTSKRAIAMAKWLAGALDAEIVLLHVADRLQFGHPALPDDMVARIEGIVEQARSKELSELAAKTSAARALLRHGDPADGILEAVGEIEPVMVIMGTHGRRGLNRLLMGSIAAQVVRACPVPVITVRAMPEDVA